MPDDLSWHAEPVPPERRADVYKEQASFRAIDRKRGRVSSLWAWSIAGISAMTALAAVASLGVVIYRERPPEPQYIFDNATTGIGAVAIPAHDAIAHFGQAEATADIVKYVQARLGYVDVIDHEQWATVRAMSTAEAFREYDAWRKSSLSPKNQLGENGHVIILPGWQMDAHPVRAPDGVWSHTITIRTQQVKGTQIGPIETWRITLTFRWDAALRLSSDDAIRNPHRFQVITFEAHQL